MAKALYGLALACLLIGFLDLSGAAPGTRREAEAGILFVLAAVFGLAGFLASRASTKTCAFCGERIRKAAIKCKHCGSDLAAGDQRPSS